MSQAIIHPTPLSASAPTLPQPVPQSQNAASLLVPQPDSGPQCEVCGLLGHFLVIDRVVQPGVVPYEVTVQHSNGTDVFRIPSGHPGGVEGYNLALPADPMSARLTYIDSGVVSRSVELFVFP